MTTNSLSTIGTDLVVKGRIRRCRSLDVHGYVEGGVEADELRIQPGGRVFGIVRADRLEVHGQLQGDVAVRTLILIGTTGKVVGNVRYGQLALQPGGELSADVRNVPPEVHGDFQIAVRRGRWVPITLADLNAVDPDNTAAEIRFSVSDLAGGYVAREGEPAAAIDTFTQAELASGTIIFMHDGSGGGSGGFQVTVTDKAGASAAPQRVTVSVV